MRGAPAEPSDGGGVGSVLWVDYGKGDDATGDGSEARPLKTIAAAVARVPALPAPRTVFLAASAVHMVNQTVTLGPEHANTTITTAPPHGGASAGARAVVSGGVRFTPQWSPHPAPPTQAPTAGRPPPPAVAVWRAPGLPVGLAGALEIFDGDSSLRSLIPARYPNTKANTLAGNYGISLGKPLAWLPEQDLGNATVVTNASYTRPGMFKAFSVGVGGPAAGYEPPVSYWATPHPVGGGGVTRTLPSGFVFENNAGVHGGGLNLTTAGKEGLLFMKQSGNWGSWVFAVNATDEAANGTQATVHLGEGGWQEARGGKNGGPMFFSHRCDLLDAPNEWCVGAGDGALYLATAAGAGATPPPRTIVVAAVDEIFRVAGSQATPATGIRIANLTLTQTAPTYVSPGCLDFVFKGVCLKKLARFAARTANDCGHTLVHAGTKRNRLARHSVVVIVL